MTELQRLRKKLRKCRNMERGVHFQWAAASWLFKEVQKLNIRLRQKTQKLNERTARAALAYDRAKAGRAKERT